MGMNNEHVHRLEVLDDWVNLICNSAILQLQKFNKTEPLYTTFASLMINVLDLDRFLKALPWLYSSKFMPQDSCLELYASSFFPQTSGFVVYDQMGTYMT